MQIIHENNRSDAVRYAKKHYHAIKMHRRAIFSSGKFANVHFFLYFCTQNPKSL